MVWPCLLFPLGFVAALSDSAATKHDDVAAGAEVDRVTSTVEIRSRKIIEQATAIVGTQAEVAGSLNTELPRQLTV